MKEQSQARIRKSTDERRGQRDRGRDAAKTEPPNKTHDVHISDSDEQSSPESPQRPEAVRGLVCSRCGCRHFRVIYTRAIAGGIIRRRRECRHCGRRVTTREAMLG